jgi:Mrp family chromosome partitioning ATPase/capsular polysaccharide biosynthesis protein
VGSPAPPVESDLRALWAPIWDRKWLILAIVAIATVATYVYYDRQPDVFESSTVLFVAGSDDVATALQGLPAAPGNDRNLQNQAVLLKTRAVAERVAKQIHFQGNPIALLGSVKSRFQSGQDFLTITATAGSASEAAKLADAFSRAFIDLRATQTRSTVQKALNEAQKQMANLGNAPGLVGQRDTLRQTIANLRATLGTSSGTVRQLDAAGVPASPSSPRPKRSALFALFVSLALGCALAFLLSRLDRRLKHTDEIRDVYGLPLISVIPHVGRPTILENGRPAVNKDFHEAFRGLHANLRLLTLDNPAKIILVTSAIPGEGKSTVARNLALVYREWGLRVALVEADLRRPVLAESLGMKPEYGLTNVLTGAVDIDDAFVDVHVDIAGLDTLAAVARAGREDGESRPPVPAAGPDSRKQNGGSYGALRLLAAGPQPANPQAVIASDRMREVLEDIAARHDVLLIDSSPLLAVSDSFPILSMVDVCVLVSRVGVTTRDAARRVIEVVGRSPNNGVIGVVANDLPGGGVASSTYGYGYGYGYTDAGEKSSRAGRGTDVEAKSRA